MGKNNGIRRITTWPIKIYLFRISEKENVAFIVKNQAIIDYYFFEEFKNEDFQGEVFSLDCEFFLNSKLMFRKTPYILQDDNISMEKRYLKLLKKIIVAD